MNATTTLLPLLTFSPVIHVPQLIEHFTPAPYFDYLSNWSNTTAANLSQFISRAKIPKYSSWETILIATLTAITAIITVLGNILVLFSFVVERALRQPSNFFIASLAVTDLLIGLFSMPAYTTYLLLEHWPMPNILCDLWLSLDYTVCLVSQYNVLLITIDRFCSVKIPAKYRNWRTRRKVQIMIIATWIIPSSIFFTIHLGWDTMVNGGQRGMDVGSCDAQYIKANPTFNVVLIFSYFWSTMVVLLILYAGIYQTAFSLQRKSQAKHEKMQQMVRLGSTAANKVVETAKQTGFLTVHTLKPVNYVSVALNSLTVTQGRPTMDTNMDVTTPQKSTTNDSGSTDSASFPSDADQTEEGQLTKGTRPPQHNKPPIKGGTTARPRVFRELKQRVAQKTPRIRGRSEVLVPKIQPPPKNNKKNYQDLEDKASLIELMPREVCDDKCSSPNPDPNPLGKPVVCRSLPSVDRTATSRDHLTLACASQPSIGINASTTLHTILLAKELNDEIRLLFAQRQQPPPRSESAPPSHGIQPPSNEEQAFVEPVWIPRVPFPVSFDELPSGLILPFTGQTPLNKSNDWRYIDQESLKSPNPSIEGTHVSTPSNRSSFNSPLIHRHTPSTSPKQMTPKSSLKSSTPSPTDLGGVLPYNGGVAAPTLKIIRPAPRVSIRPEISDIGEESTRYESDQRSVFADHDQVPLSNHAVPLVAIRNNSEKLRAFGRRLRQAASRGSKRKNIAKRQQSRSENRARKALKTITFIMGAFVLCWTPWHIFATIEGFCNGCVQTELYALSYWLCYLNSPINPFCYALANQQFKKTFIRVLNRDFHRT